MFSENVGIFGEINLEDIITGGGVLPVIFLIVETSPRPSPPERVLFPDWRFLMGVSGCHDYHFLGYALVFNFVFMQIFKSCFDALSWIFFDLANVTSYNDDHF